MPNTVINIRKSGVGNQIVRLRDVPETTREFYGRKLLAAARDDAEYFRLVELIYDPGDAGGRIAA